MNVSKFVGITDRLIITYESTVTLSVWVVSGYAKVGEKCYIDTEIGIQEVVILAIKTLDGFKLEVNADTQTLITFANIPCNVTIPFHSIVSANGYTMEEYRNLPFEMSIDNVFKYHDTGRVVVGKIFQGSIKEGDEIRIFNDKIDFITRVEGIERGKKFQESMSYGEYCGLFLYPVPEEMFCQITEGTKITNTR